MKADLTAGMSAALAKNWWLVALRGVLAIVLGILALTLPGATVLALVLYYSVFAVITGIFGIGSAVRAASAHHRWMWLVFEGLVNIAAGIVAFVWPGITALVFVALIGAWAVVTGVLTVVASFRLHGTHGRWWLILGGIVSVLFGALLFIAPMAGILVLVWWLGAFWIVLGITLLGVAFKLRPHAARPAPAT